MLRTTVFTWLLGLALPALAQQGPNDVEMLTKHAGTWAVDCAKPGTRLTVSVNALTLDVLINNAGIGESVFFVMSDKSGSYLGIQADGPLLAQFGKPALAGKFRRCA